MRCTFLNKQDGSATLLAIFMSAILTTVAIGFNWIVKEHIKTAEGIKIKTEAMLNANTTFDTLIYLLLTGKKTRMECILQNGNKLLDITNIPLDGSEVDVKGGVKISIRDSNGMLSLTSLKKSAMERLIETLSGEEATGIIESYRDWIDSDSFHRINGAEEYYYNSKGLPYKPRNYPIQYKEEFALIKGMNREIYSKIEPHITILPSLGFNPNTASEDVLMAYLNIDRDVAKSVEDYIARKPIFLDRELFFLTGRRITATEGVFFYPSPYLEITIKAGIPDTAYTIHAGVNTREDLLFPYSVIYWREE